MAERSIDEQDVIWMRERLAKNGHAHLAIANKDPRALFVESMRACEGIREAGGNNKGPAVVRFQMAIGKAEREPWCMALIQFCIAYVEFELKINSAIHASEHCVTVWNKSPKACRVKYHPLPGAIAIWNYEGTSSGHTGCVLSADRDTGLMRLIEGNTEKGLADNVIVREGGGVYLTERKLGGQGTMKLLGFLKPF